VARVAARNAPNANDDFVIFLESPEDANAII